MADWSNTRHDLWPKGVPRDWDMTTLKPTCVTFSALYDYLLLFFPSPFLSSPDPYYPMITGLPYHLTHILGTNVLVSHCLPFRMTDSY